MYFREKLHCVTILFLNRTISHGEFRISENDQELTKFEQIMNKLVAGIETVAGKYIFWRAPHQIMMRMARGAPGSAWGGEALLYKLLYVLLQVCLLCTLPKVVIFHVVKKNVYRSDRRVSYKILTRTNAQLLRIHT